jgi:tetratricopeptide (TPR) repeat protein
MDRDELKECQIAIHQLIEADDYENALPLIYAVLEEYPDDAATLHFLGYIWLMSDKPAFAYQLFRRALQENPANKALWTSLGRACHELAHYEDAIKFFMKSAELDPSYALAYSNLSATLVQLSEWDDVEKAATTALELSPTDLNAQLNLAHCYLAKGEWDNGWRQWGKSLGGKFRKEYTYGDEARWRGEEGKRLVIYGEQGLGDEIFYASCINDAIDRSEAVYIDCDPRLEQLFKRSFPRAIVHGTRRELTPEWVQDADINSRCAIGGLPEFFRHDNRDFPGTPYLVADEQKRLTHRRQLQEAKSNGAKLLVGITTHGGKRMTNAKGRQLTEEDLKPLLKRKDIQLVSLDYKVEDKIDGIYYPECAENTENYDELAALIAELDMVIGVPTTAQHCAAALGVKTWCFVPKRHQWRYAQPSMPWYRSMRLIYQDNRSWKEVVEYVERQL